jgi:pimeloyl-ACP methyl ester carboxylesterase
MNMATVAVPGVDLVVREWGSENERALVFWPGLNPWGSLQLVEVGPLLARRGFRVLSIAAPGAGETPALGDPKAYRPTRLAQLVVAAADSFGLDRFGYMGASWGASIGVHLAVRSRKRVEALVLLDAGHTDVASERTLAEWEQQVEADQGQFAFESWEAYFDWVRSRVRAWRPALDARYRTAMIERDGRIVARAEARSAAWALHGVAIEPPSSTHARLGELGLPILLLLAADAEGTDASEQFQALVPQAQLRVLEAGHDIVEDQPEQLADLVASWLSAPR